MKMTFLSSAVAMVGLLAGSFVAQAQSGGAGAAGAAGGAGTGAGTVSSGVTVGGAAGGVVTAPQAGSVATPGAAPVGAPNTIGGASIVQPTATQPVGGGSVLQTTPNTIGGGSTLQPAPGIAGGNTPATGTLPGGGTVANQGVALNTLPAGVQNVLQGFAANGTLGTVNQLQGPSGPFFRATVTQNGVPMELQIASNGRILSRTPVNTAQIGGQSAQPGTAPAGALEGAQAGLPTASLPPAVQTSIQRQLGPNAQVQTVSRDDLANGTVFRVSALQNGVPTEFRFGANGTLLSSTPLGGAATSFVVPGTAVVPASSVLLEDLPATVQNTIREQTGNGAINRIAQHPTPNGVSYIVTYDQNGRPMNLVVGPDGTVRANVPTAVGAAGAATRGGARSGEEPESRENTRDNRERSAISVDDLPEEVEAVLRRESPNAQVRYVNRERRVGGNVFVVGLRGENEVGEITISEKGEIIRDSRLDMSEIATPRVSQEADTQQGIPFRDVPVAIQNAIKAYATASDIRSITLGADKDGKAVYDVIFFRDGRRDRMIVTKNGALKRIEQDVSPALDLNSGKPPILAIGDLPQEVQDAIRRQTDHVRIKEIGMRPLGDQMVYSARYETNGEMRELLVDSKGVTVLPQGDASLDVATAPLPAPVPEDEPVRVVNATAEAADTADPDVEVERVGADRSVGASATAELGTAASERVSGEATVKLEELPDPVQNTAKKLAGTGTIESIKPALSDAGVGYEVTFLENGERRKVVLNREGVIQESTLPEP